MYGVSKEPGILGEELVVRSEVVCVGDVKWLVIAEGSIPGEDGSSSILGMVHDPLPAGSDSRLEDFSENGTVVGTINGVTICWVVQVQRLVDLGTRGFVFDSRVDAEEHHG